MQSWVSDMICVLGDTEFIDVPKLERSFRKQYPISTWRQVNFVCLHEPSKRKAREKGTLIHGTTRTIVLVAKWFVAYPVNYTYDTPDKSRNAFWIGQILSVDNGKRSVFLRTHHTTTKNNLNLTSNVAQYKLWNGSRIQNVEEVRFGCILEAFELTANRRVPLTTLRNIEKALDARARALVLYDDDDDDDSVDALLLKRQRRNPVNEDDDDGFFNETVGDDDDDDDDDEDDDGTDDDAVVDDDDDDDAVDVDERERERERE
jgi:hypothetical protein